VAKPIIDAVPDKRPPQAVGRTLLENIHRFVSAVGANLHLDRARADCQRELEEQLARVSLARTDLWDQFQDLREEAEVQFPSLTESKTIPGIARSNLGSLASVDLWLKNARRSDIADEHVIWAHPAQTLWMTLQRLSPPDTELDETTPLYAVVSRVETLRHQLMRLQRTCSLLTTTHPAAKWSALRDVVHDCNPDINSISWLLEQGGNAPRFRHYAHFLRDEGSLGRDTIDWLEAFSAEMANAVSAIRSELQSRLGNRASALWLLERYAKRCRRLRRQELTALVKAQRPAERERFLTRDAALFLFDQGLEVLTEQSLGQHRYDLIGESLLVEAKIISKDKRPLAAIVDGLKQLHQYQIALGHEGHKPEPVLVLFRLSGRSVDLPTEYVMGNHRVAIVLVDLGLSSESGHNAEASTTVTIEDINAKLDRS
jgi:hypothetical protein